MVSGSLSPTMTNKKMLKYIFKMEEDFPENILCKINALIDSRGFFYVVYTFDKGYAPCVDVKNSLKTILDNVDD